MDSQRNLIDSKGLKSAPSSLPSFTSNKDSDLHEIQRRESQGNLIDSETVLVHHDLKSAPSSLPSFMSNKDFSFYETIVRGIESQRNLAGLKYVHGLESASSGFNERTGNDISRNLSYSLLISKFIRGDLLLYEYLIPNFISKGVKERSALFQDINGKAFPNEKHAGLFIRLISNYFQKIENPPSGRVSRAQMLNEKVMKKTSTVISEMIVQRINFKYTNNIKQAKPSPEDSINYIVKKSLDFSLRNPSTNSMGNILEEVKKLHKKIQSAEARNSNSDKDISQERKREMGIIANKVYAILERRLLIEKEKRGAQING